MAATIPHILEYLVNDGLLWVAYPKRISGVETDLSREVFWEIMRAHGYKAVTQVYIDDTWTAMRFRHLDLIGK
jgi:ribosomal protein L25 (general stress protein Ctc)